MAEPTHVDPSRRSPHSTKEEGDVRSSSATSWERGYQRIGPYLKGNGIRVLPRMVLEKAVGWNEGQPRARVDSTSAVTSATVETTTPKPLGIGCSPGVNRSHGKGRTRLVDTNPTTSNC